MFSFKFKSFDQNFKSNTILVERLIVSPLFVSKYTEDIKENIETPFKENCSFVSNMQNSFFKEPMSCSNKDLSLVHQAKSSLFAIEPQIQIQTQTHPSHHQLVFLNQIMINGKCLQYFPIIIAPDEKLLLNIIHPFEETLNMKILPTAESKKVLIDFSLVDKSDNFLMRYKNLKQSLEQDENLMFAKDTPKDIIKYLFEKIKYIVHSIQLNYIFQKRKTINENLLLNCQKLIEKCNEIAELFFNDFLNRRALMKEIKEDKMEESSIDFNDFVNKKQSDPHVIYCKLCRRKFTNGCALGGHMSRVHPHKSEQYKKKQKIRERRNEHRRAIYESKKELCCNHNCDYDDMLTSQKGKRNLKKLITQNKKEYSNILHQIKIAKGLTSHY